MGTMPLEEPGVDKKKKWGEGGEGGEGGIEK